MAQQLPITIENKLIKEKRDIHVYHHSSRGAHIIGYDSAIELPLDSVDHDDYLYISIVKGPGNVWRDCVIHLPLWMDFEFSSRGDLILKHSQSNDARRFILKIPPGPPTWELRLMRPTRLERSEEIKITIAEK